MIYNCDSHVGKVRKNNEDYCMGEVIQTEEGSIGIFALADGMGGHKKGEVASKIAVESIIQFLKENICKDSRIKMDYLDDVIKQGYNYANKEIYFKSLEDESFEGMGTTLVVAVIYKKQAVIANVGDSRCYLLHDDEFRKIKMEISDYQIKDMIEDSITIGDLKVVKKIYENGDVKYISKIAEKITVRDNMIVLFAIKLEDKANLIFACSKNIKNISMNNLLKDSITLIDGRGGGSNFLAQGGGKNSSNLEGTMEYALRKINTL